MTAVSKVQVTLNPNLYLIMLCLGRELLNITELFLIKQVLSLLAYVLLAV